MAHREREVAIREGEMANREREVAIREGEVVNREREWLSGRERWLTGRGSGYQGGKVG